MVDQSQSFFQKVGTRKERERAFILLTQSKATFECQMPGKNIIKIVPDFIQDSFMMVITNEDIPMNQEVIVTFQIGQEKYFMKTTFKPHKFERHFMMSIEPALFKLQRRNSFRIQIPIEYMARIYIHTVDGKTSSQKFPLFDLSGGGLSFEIPSNIPFHLQKDQNIEGELEVGGRFKKRFAAVVRHVAKVGSQGSGLSKIGTEFTRIGAIDQQEIVNTVMDIHRDMFSKFKIGSR
jgi:c-di-GMP-binding flagellar brake protein YcgR